MKKFILAAIFLMTSVTSLACIPDGVLLDTKQKVVFEESLRQSNLACAEQISREIGDFAAANVNVFEDADESFVEYTVVGPSKRIKIVRLNFNGNNQFYCEEITGLPRGC